jgi:hypothetical protein
MKTDNECWRVIDEARRAAKGNFEREAENIVVHVAKFRPEEIVAFGQWVRQRMEDATLTDLYLVAAWIFDVTKGWELSGDAWENWRGWLVGRGREDYFAGLKNADVVADLFTTFEDFVAGELIEIAANWAYQRATGSRDYPDAMFEPSLLETYPAYWSDEDVKAKRLVERYPRMVKRFGLPSFVVR